MSDSPRAVDNPDSPSSIMPPEFTAILAGVLDHGYEDLFDGAEDAIAAAQLRHPAATDRIFHSFALLAPGPHLVTTDFVYRSHCTELLDRVAADADTQPATAAEVCCAMLSVAKLAPLRSTAAGLYMRMWRTAGFPEIDGFTELSDRHEALESSTIDDHEAFVRRRLTVNGRRLGAISCEGRHHGEPVACAYTRSTQLLLDI